MKIRHSTTLSPSNSTVAPQWYHRQMAVVRRTKLPPVWGKREVIRADGSRSDRYYEPETGRKFRSIKEIERYFNGEEYIPRRSPRKLTPHNHNYEQMMISYGGKMLKLEAGEGNKNNLAIVPSVACKTPFSLPDGWIVKQVPRKYDTRCIDKYYYEPEMVKRFRSLVSVERYLEELEENAPLSKALEEIQENKPLSKYLKLRKNLKTSPNNAQGSSFATPPMKVNWVLASPQGDAWTPFLSDTMVPDSTKQQWTDRFILLMNDGTSNSPGSLA